MRALSAALAIGTVAQPDDIANAINSAAGSTPRNRLERSDMRTSSPIKSRPPGRAPAGEAGRGLVDGHAKSPLAELVGRAQAAHTPAQNRNRPSRRQPIAIVRCSNPDAAIDALLVGRCRANFGGKTMGWRQRLLQMTLAGGMLPVAGCSPSGLGGGGGVPCGNANPDPCICDRPSSNAMWKAACDAKTACEKIGGSWISAGYTGACEVDAGADDGSGGPHDADNADADETGG
jgi:hypothetical protein